MFEQTCVGSRTRLLDRIALPLHCSLVLLRGRIGWAGEWFARKRVIQRRLAPMAHHVTEGHARERLVAEFGTAFLCMLPEITPDLSKLHAANIPRWIHAIKTDRRAALSLAVKDAECALEYLYFLGKDIVLFIADRVGCG